MTSSRSGSGACGRSWLEPFIFVLLVLVYIWWVQPWNPAAGIAGFGLLVALPPISQVLHHERPRDLGFRLDNLGRSAPGVAIMTAGAGLVVIAAGMIGGGVPRLTWRVLLEAATYPIWALGQQYALQSFVFRRLRSAWGHGRAAAVSALLFSLLHLPNPVLAGLTLTAGYAWCRLYDREPNLYTLAVSHGLLAVLVLHFLPLEWTHGLTIGPGYGSWTPP